MGSPRDGYSSRWFIRAQWFSTWSDRLADATIVLSDPDFPQKRFSKPPKRPYLKKAKKIAPGWDRTRACQNYKSTAKG